MGDGRNVYAEPRDRFVLRTADVYQDELDDDLGSYSETVLALVADYRNGGAPEGWNAQAMVGKSKRGEVALRLFAVMDGADRRIERIGFQTRGCLAMTACASMVCLMVEGKTFDEALAVTADDVRRAVDGVPWDKAHTPVFAVECVRALVGDWLMREGASLGDLDAQLPCDQDSIDCIMCEHCSLRDGRVELMVDQAIVEGQVRP